MNKSTLQKILQQHYPDIEFQLQGDGCHLQIVAIGEMFSGMTRIKRQQLLNKVLKPFIQEGHLHAVNYQLLTTAEAQAKKLSH